MSEDTKSGKDPMLDMFDDDIECTSDIKPSIGEELQYVKPEHIEMSDACFAAEVKMFLTLKRELAKAGLTPDPDLHGLCGFTFKELGLIGGAPVTRRASNRPDFSSVEFPSVGLTADMPSASQRRSEVSHLDGEIEALRDAIRDVKGEEYLKSADRYYEEVVNPEVFKIILNARFRCQDKKLVVAARSRCEWFGKLLDFVVPPDTCDREGLRPLPEKYKMTLPKTFSSLLKYHFSSSQVAIAESRLLILQDLGSRDFDDVELYLWMLHICNSSGFRPCEFLSYAFFLNASNGPRCFCGEQVSQLSSWLDNGCNFSKWCRRMRIVEYYNGYLLCQPIIDWKAVLGLEALRLEGLTPGKLGVLGLGRRQDRSSTRSAGCSSAISH